MISLQGKGTRYLRPETARRHLIYFIKFPSGHIGAFQRFVGKTMGLVHILAETDHTQDARHHLMHAIGIDTCDFKSNGVRAAVDACHGY